MITALILINAERQHIPDTAQALLAIPEVREVYSVTGEYDLVAIVHAREYDRLAEVVTEKFAKIDTITRTETMMAFRVYSNHDMERLFAIGMEESDRK